MFPVYMIPLGPILIAVFYLLKHYIEYDRLLKISTLLDEIMKRAKLQHGISFASAPKSVLFNKVDVYRRIENQLKQLLNRENHKFGFRTTTRLKFESDAYRAYSELDRKIDLLLKQFEVPFLFKKIAMLDTMIEKLNSILKQKKYLSSVQST